MEQDFWYIQQPLMMSQRSISRHFALLACFLAFAAALTGCGSGGSTTSALTKTEFTKKANAICKEAEQRREASFLKAWHSQSGGINGKAEQEKLVLGAMMPPISRMNKELQQLQPPSSEAAAAKKLVSSLGVEIKRIEAKPISVFTGELGQFTLADEVAIANGLTACSEV